MRLLRIGLNGDYVYAEKIKGQQRTVRVPGSVEKKEARKRAKASFDELKRRIN